MMNNNIMNNNIYKFLRLDVFENGSEWIVNENSKDIDYINFKEGKQGLKLIAKNGKRSDRVINNNFSATKLMIDFDDGDINVYKYAFPILKSNGQEE